ncbi:MAG: ferritin family protein [Ignavibacteria bacterium]|jgi:rubrerythrin|nr:ferritin family protein [Ignavibacteria bacterium]
MKDEVFLNIINFAIEREIEAAELYAAMQEKADSPAIKNLLIELEAMEVVHIEGLTQLINDKGLSSENKGADSIQFSDYVIEASESNDFKETLKTAILREEKSSFFYSNLAGKYLDEKLKSLFLSLSKEEAEHKKMLENIYYSEAE